jgi:hypothetical protein
MKSYIVRIYRNEKAGSEQLLGTVERPGEEIKLAFTSFDELRNILGPHAAKDVFAEVLERQEKRKSNQGTNKTEGHRPESELKKRQ